VSSGENCSSAQALACYSRRHSSGCNAARACCVISFLYLWRCWRALPAAIHSYVNVSLCRLEIHQDLGQARAAVDRFAWGDKELGPSWGTRANINPNGTEAPTAGRSGRNNYPENGLVKPPRHNTRALSPAGMSGGKAPLRLAAQKSRLHAPLAPMCIAPA
jgi:hypothetical protein